MRRVRILSRVLVIQTGMVDMVCVRLTRLEIYMVIIIIVLQTERVHIVVNV